MSTAIVVLGLLSHATAFLGGLYLGTRPKVSAAAAGVEKTVKVDVTKLEAGAAKVEQGVAAVKAAVTPAPAPAAPPAAPHV